MAGPRRFGTTWWGRAWIDALERSARGSTFALAQMHVKEGDATRSALLERTANGDVIERFNSDDGQGMIVGFDVSEETLCLLRSSPTDQRDPVTDEFFYIFLFLF